MLEIHKLLDVGLRAGLSFYLIRFTSGGEGTLQSELERRVEGVQICPLRLEPYVAIVGVGKTGRLAVEKVVESLSQHGGFELVKVACPNLPRAIAPLLEMADLVLVIADVAEGTAQAVTALGSLFKEAKALTVGLVGEADVALTPRGKRTMARLASHMDAFVLQAKGESDAAKRAALMACGVLCIVRLLLEPGPICLGFEDIRAIMHDSGLAYMGHAAAVGEGSVLIATRTALESVAARVPPERAGRFLLGLSVGPEVTLSEVQSAAEQVFHAAPDAEFIYGIIVEPSSTPPRTKATLFATHLVEA